MRTTLAVAVWVLALSPGRWVSGAETDARPVDYTRDVKPILVKRCVACHGVLRQNSGLRLDTARRLFKGGDGGPAVVAGKLDESPLIDAVKGTDGFRMPPEGGGEALSAAEVRTLEQWVVAGAKAPAHEPEPPDPRSHWSFRPPVRPAVPTPRNPGWSLNPIDAFLSASHDAHGLTPSSPTDRAALLRRVALDLTGLAPSPEELKGFLADASPDAYERAVDRLLASPRYGERWGRHWMDVWRYSDWDGYGQEVRESQPHIWRWRDWIVESLNQDKGYDRMVVEMLAADEAAPGDDSALRATGFLARNWYKFNRNVWVDNIIEHTSKGFLGITLNCARCHDHKYDPIAQTDYYRFRAFFEPHEFRTDRVPGQPDTKKDGLVHVYDAKPDEPTFLFVRGDEKEPEKSRKLNPGLPSVLSRRSSSLSIVPVTLPAEVSKPGLRAFVQTETLAQAKADVAAAEKKLADEKAKAGGKTVPGVTNAEAGLAAARAGQTAAEARVAAERARQAGSAEASLLARLAAMAERQAAFLAAEVALDSAVTKRTQAQAALKEKPNDAARKKADAASAKAAADARKALDAARTALAKTSDDFTPLGPTYPANSTGRRLALAKWITARDNPLAARVAVNHVWMRHFGAPLVPSLTDFGLNGRAPSHPDLLDWLAVEFMESGWSQKHLHRLIVTSQAYRMRSSADDDSVTSANRAADPNNLYLWRMNPRRMEAEAVRDNVLAASGRLSNVMGGPDLDPASALADGRRSLYFRHAKEKRAMFLRLFDSPSVVSCYRRSESVVPQQALALANSPLTREQAKVVSRRLSEHAAADPDFVSAAFVRLLGREPDQAERSECLAYLARTPGDRARESLVHVLFNHNDFVTIR
ncbi:MAG: PSD1 and planctomycete cytochrome C domain-containing protein [Isosphaeraceae bacterium]